MPGKNAKADSGGFSAKERAAMKERAAELRAEGKKGAKKADGLQAVLDKIAEMALDDRALAERVHVRKLRPPLSCRRRHGTIRVHERGQQVVVFFQDAASSSTGTSTLGLQEAANLDDGDMWPVSVRAPAVEPW